ncbi:uncharacterized protein LOC119593069 [Penaeus monodon]|uniref:uncharacterized protein LOC119593069 n=1 Tax=Penaeus monodon TaxID=6687 RepID=UPI0018A77C85|nr:uncharacterized protein LOC119593069 [Penaeus monodon]XP_037797914.1 uncharacterized protein LOC119593069 [Penaeus monodon]
MMYSMPWLLFLVLAVWDPRPSRAFIFPSLPQDVCDRHFSISNDTDINKLTGEWVTVASTRKVFPCHRFSGKVVGADEAVLRESWRRTGWFGTVLDYEAEDEVAARSDGILEVTRTRLAAVLVPGRLAVRSFGDSLVLVQCRNFVFFSLPSITVLTREVPSDPRAAVRRLFSQVRVTASIPSFYVADHNQCKNDSRTDTMFVHDYDLQSVDDLRNEVLQTTPERNVK